VIHAAAYDVTRLEAYPNDDAWALNRPTHFLVKVTILDEASGRAADREYIASGASNGFFLSGTGVVNLNVESRIDTFELGRNRYTIQARVGESESAAHIELDLEATHHNPEPGTLALAVMGLAGLATRRRRYRSAS
jgi:MYXO-CTERM domain-containing protein